MAKITIKNLIQNVDLDRQAMLAIAGGVRARGQRMPIGQSILRTTRIVDYPPGFSHHPLRAKVR